MQDRAIGTFEVKVLPLTPADTVEHAGLGRMSIDKQFSGDLVGTSVGQMLATGGPAEKARAYVALERVTGTLAGRAGSFALMHSGTMTSTAMELRVSVVPESGTGALVGLAGTLRIIIEGGQHAYELDYTLAP